jgi:hypothetical protein
MIFMTTPSERIHLEGERESGLTRPPPRLHGENVPQRRKQKVNRIR